MAARTLIIQIIKMYDLQISSSQQQQISWWHMIRSKNSADKLHGYLADLYFRLVGQKSQVLI